MARAPGCTAGCRALWQRRTKSRWASLARLSPTCSRLNPETIELINAHPEIFEIVERPFAHDLALLRSLGDFRINVELGRRVIARAFKNVSRYFLPSEFMLTNEQVHELASQGVAALFINASRFSDEVQSKIPVCPYTLEGILGATLACIPLPTAGSRTPTSTRCTAGTARPGTATSKTPACRRWPHGATARAGSSCLTAWTGSVPGSTGSPRDRALLYWRGLSCRQLRGALRT